MLLLARCSCAVQVVAGNKLYVAGGLARGAALDTLQVFDGDTWTWSLEQVSSSRQGEAGLRITGGFYAESAQCEVRRMRSGPP